MIKKIDIGQEIKLATVPDKLSVVGAYRKLAIQSGFHFVKSLLILPFNARINRSENQHSRFVNVCDDDVPFNVTFVH